MFIVKYFLYVGLALFGAIWGVDAWIGAPAPEPAASQSHIVTALKEFAHRGEGSSSYRSAYQYAVREPARTAPVAFATTADNGMAQLAQVADSRAEMSDAKPAAKRDAAARKPAIHHRRTASRARGSTRNQVASSRSRYGSVRMVENASSQDDGLFTLFR